MSEGWAVRASIAGAPSPWILLSPAACTLEPLAGTSVLLELLFCLNRASEVPSF